MARTGKRQLMRILKEYEWYKWIPKENVYIVGKNDLQCLLNINGKKLCKLKYQFLGVFDTEGIIEAFKFESGNVKLIRMNSKGEEVSLFQYIERGTQRNTNKKHKTTNKLNKFLDKIKLWFS